MTKKIKNLYPWILKNKILTICVLFTLFTMLDTIPILFGLWPPKEGINPYIHLLGRLALHTTLVFGIYLFDIIRRRIKSTILVYIIVFIITWLLLMCYLWINSFFTELHPDAVYYMTRSYGFMYLLLGVIVFLIRKFRKSNNK